MVAADNGIGVAWRVKVLATVLVAAKRPGSSAARTEELSGWLRLILVSSCVTAGEVAAAVASTRLLRIVLSRKATDPSAQRAIAVLGIVGAAGSVTVAR